MTEIDQILDRISEKTLEVKEMSISIGHQLDQQSEIIDRALKTTEESNLILTQEFIPVSERNTKAIIAASVGIVATSIATVVVGPIVTPIVAVPCVGWWMYSIMKKSTR